MTENTETVTVDETTTTTADPAPKKSRKPRAAVAAPAKKSAAKAAKSRVTFAPGACHHRSAAGAPDCNRKVEMKSANLCGTAAEHGHQQAWAKAARERSAAAAGPRAAKAPKSAGSSAKTAGAAKRKPAPNSGGAKRTVTPPVPAMGTGVPVVTRVNVPESYVPAMVQLLVPGAGK